MEQLKEKIAYLAGLAEGLDLDTTTKEGKLLKAIVGALEDIAEEVASLDEEIGEIEELIDEIDYDLGAVEEDLYEDEEEDDWDDEDEYEDDYFEITCPNCDEKIYIDEEIPYTWNYQTTHVYNQHNRLW